MTSHQEPVSPHAAKRRVRNVNTMISEGLTPGQRIVDTVARIMGSWRFIIIQSIILPTWISLNAIGWIRHWDPYPFILLTPQSGIVVSGSLFRPNHHDESEPAVGHRPRVRRDRL